MEIVTPQGNRVKAHVNATTGAALLHKDYGPASPNDRQQLEASKITLKQALEAALRHTPGTAVEAELEQDAGHTVFTVDVVTTAGQRVEITLNPADGNVLRAERD